METLKTPINQTILHGTVIGAKPKMAKDQTNVVVFQIETSHIDDGKLSKEKHHVRYHDNFQTRLDKLEVGHSVLVVGEIRTHKYIGPEGEKRSKQIIKAGSVTWPPGQLESNHIIDDLKNTEE